MKIQLIFLLLVMFLVGTPGWAKTNPTEANWDYAQKLYQEGEYFRAITEFKRVEFQNPRSPLAWKARLWIVKSLLAGQEFDQAIQLATQETAQPNPEPEFYVYLGLGYLDRHRSYPYSLRQEDISQGVQALKQVPPRLPSAKYIQGFLADYKQLDPQPVYSPTLAGGLSALFPGAGSAYLGRWKEASYAFLITGLFVGSALQTAHNGQLGLAALFGGFSLVFYGGNIYVAVNSAYKTNDLARAKALQQIRQKQGLFFTPHQPNRRF